MKAINSMRECRQCHAVHTKKEWLDNGDRCPDCAHTGFVMSRSGPVNVRVTPENPYRRDPTLQPVLTHQKKTVDKRYLIGRIALVVGIVIVAVLLSIAFNNIPVSVLSSANATVPTVQPTEETRVIPTYEQVTVVREVFQKIMPVATPWNTIKTIQVILYGMAILFALLDRIMSNQWYDAAIAIGAAVLCQFGSAHVFNGIAELLTKIPQLSIGVVLSHWIWAFAITLICLGAVFWVSLTGTTDWTPMALFLGLLAGGSIFFGHLGVLQTLFLIPSGTALSVLSSKWLSKGDISVSVLTFILLLTANGFALEEAFKPYRGKKRSIASILILAISVVGYFPLRLFCTNVPVLNTPIGDIVAIFVINFLIAFFLRERFDRRFGNTTAEYKMGLGKAMSPFDVVLALALIGLFMIQFVGKV